VILHLCLFIFIIFLKITCSNSTVINAQRDRWLISGKGTPVIISQIPSKQTKRPYSFILWHMRPFKVLNDQNKIIKKKNNPWVSPTDSKSSTWLVLSETDWFYSEIYLLKIYKYRPHLYTMMRMMMIMRMMISPRL